MESLLTDPYEYVQGHFFVFCDFPRLGVDWLFRSIHFRAFFGPNVTYGVRTEGKISASKCRNKFTNGMYLGIQPGSTRALQQNTPSPTLKWFSKCLSCWQGNKRSRCRLITRPRTKSKSWPFGHSLSHLQTVDKRNSTTCLLLFYQNWKMRLVDMSLKQQVDHI
jgi:hypothetical protein